VTLRFPVADHPMARAAFEKALAPYRAPLLRQLPIPVDGLGQDAALPRPAATPQPDPGARPIPCGTAPKGRNV